MNSSLSLLVGAALLGLAAPSPSFAQGMPPEARRNIHLLLDRHDKVRRQVTLTPDGYVAVTESDQPEVAAALKGHVRQMEERFKQGLMVRRHDPAFVEFAAHYADLTHQFEATAQGVKMTVRGKTPAAVKVAQNHASVVTDFATNGWEGHDRSHPAILEPGTATAKPAAPAPSADSRSSLAPPGCCGMGGGCCQAGAPAQAPARKGKKANAGVSR